MRLWWILSLTTLFFSTDGLYTDKKRQIGEKRQASHQNLRASLMETAKTARPSSDSETITSSSTSSTLRLRLHLYEIYLVLLLLVVAAAYVLHTTQRGPKKAISSGNIVQKQVDEECRKPVDTKAEGLQKDMTSLSKPSQKKIEEPAVQIRLEEQTRDNETKNVQTSAEQASTKTSLKTLSVTISKASGLPRKNLVGNAPWCLCEALGTSADTSAAAARFQTSSASNAAAPVWNETHKFTWKVGQDLRFSIYSRGLLASRQVGSALLHARHFYPQGFDGELFVAGCGDASTLHVKIASMAE
eukprot:TRINITY_DN47522_c0_g1_i1.p1 TRINITY_DN47522_c0_g1~~TRINITY_DN47522_c0_g1_i1.p1  ORF type:complete len:301 (+),score=39.43 TRINITY_DN47522_c0_g1_i1:74-976(+)